MYVKQSYRSGRVTIRGIYMYFREWFSKRVELISFIAVVNVHTHAPVHAHIHVQ